MSHEKIFKLAKNSLILQLPSTLYTSI